jgi:hypothetical protein
MLLSFYPSKMVRQFRRPGTPRFTSVTLDWHRTRLGYNRLPHPIRRAFAPDE